MVMLAVLAVFIGVSLSRWTAQSDGELEAATAYPQPRPLPAFDLVDHRGEAFTRDDLMDGWQLMFFGFTHCPDVCPLTLSVLARAVTTTDAAPPLAQVVLVSVDPERDTPARLATYVAGFDESFVGVTGSPEDIAEFAGAASIAYARVPLGEDGEYTVDHSAAVLAIDPNGAIHAVFTPPLQADAIRRDLQTLQSRYGGGA